MKKAQPASSLRLPSSSSEGLLFTSLLVAAGSVSAQTAAPVKPADQKAEDATEIAEIVVEGTQDKVYKPDRVQTPKYTQPLRDIPQTITVVPKSVMQERGATSLRDVLRNVPGVTMQAGEGGVPAGDNMSIRGFNARTDMFVDGVRDFGGFTRDPFNMEQVEVSKGPSSSNAGRGSTGGSVNMVSKTPTLEESYAGDVGVGTNDYFRSTVDINQPIGDHMALRVNGLYHTSSTSGRDEVEEERKGIAASLAFGLGTDTRLTISYFHLESDSLPDYGIPWVPPNAATTTFLNGVGEHANDDPHVPYSNFYGLKDRDYEITRTDIATIQFEHEFNDKWKLTNTVRAGQSVRDSVITAPRFFDSIAGNAAASYDGRITRQIQSRDQKDSILAEQINVIGKFNTGLLKHDLVLGGEVIYETSKNFGRARNPDPGTGPVDGTTINNPNPNAPFNGSIIRNKAYTDTDALSLAAYLFDTISLGDHWQVTGGLRYDRFDVNYKSVATVGKAPNFTEGAHTHLGRVDEMVSWRAGLVYKPVENGSIYFGYGTSFNPSAEGLALSTAIQSANNLSLDPEKSRTLELGTKWDLLADKLQLTAAVFRTDKTNARTFDAADSTDTIVLAGEQRVQGVEFGFAGSITDEWRVFGGYTYLDSEVRKSNNPLEVGHEVLNTPKQSASIWTVYDLPHGFQVGLGAQFTDTRFSSNASTAREAPGFCLFDAMIGYEVNKNFSLRVNIYNLADEEYIDRVGGGHFIPGAGRSAMLTASYKF
ncbi:TonB-dependent receptor [Brevifollis gellanilyticus]|uniref:Iron transport outer membrane receptor n=1 Tax=Brevifollis gellanilyticus TaxID=748831 RepID=A0A512MFQ7_9BACT|nr:TonB-dependent siderophore receptor [Brevifollis gellanilyticus]GEP45181.1 iron transport outer membrane receptor [Brevifollis gellanilyticus]